MLSMVRASRFDLTDLVAHVDQLAQDEWSERDLRICTVDMASGGRRVLDRHSDVALSTAVAASCAVPGLFSPQLVGSRQLVDGGVHSATNVDALPFDRIDEVVVIAPMAGSVFRGLLTASMRMRIAGTLRRELRQVPTGMRVRLFVPGVEASAVMGLDLMSKDRSADTVLAGFLEAGDMVAAATGSRR